MDGPEERGDGLPGVGKGLRLYESLAVLDPRLRETIKTQELFQDLESLEPSLTKVPLRASEILGFKVPKHQNP